MPWRISAPHGQLYLVNTPNGAVTHAFQDYRTQYIFNSLGYRGPELVDHARNVAFLGDSFTFGLFTDVDDTEVGILRKRVNETYDKKDKVQVVNAAIAASGIAEWIAYIEDYGWRLKPKIIVANLNYVSISRGYRHPLYRLNCANRTLQRADPVDARGPWPSYTKFGEQLESPVKLFLYNHSQLVMVVRKALQNAKARIAPPPPSPVSTAPKPPETNMVFQEEHVNKAEVECFTEAAFKKLNDAANALGAKLVVADIGYRWQTHIPKEKSIDLIALDAVPGVLKKLSISYIDMTDTMYHAKVNGVIVEIPGDGHPTKEAYSLLADTFWPFLKVQIDQMLSDKSSPH